MNDDWEEIRQDLERERRDGTQELSEAWIERLGHLIREADPYRAARLVGDHLVDSPLKGDQVRSFADRLEVVLGVSIPVPEPRIMQTGAS